MNGDRMPSHHGVKEKISGDYENETIRLLMERASCRNFKEKKIPPDVIDTLLTAGTHSATGGNLQPYSIIKIQSMETRKKLGVMCYQKFISRAPLHLLFCIDFRRLDRWADLLSAPFTCNSAFGHFWISFQDTIINAQSICTAADSVGLGSVYIGTISSFMLEIRDLFELPEGVLPIVLLCVGYPKKELESRKKLDTNTVVHEEKYQDLPDRELISRFDEKYPDLKVKITDKRMAEFARVCRYVGGKKFEEKCTRAVKDQGFFNPAQRYFGLHYLADRIPQENERYMNDIKEMGFHWFGKYIPKSEKS